MQTETRKHGRVPSAYPVRVTVWAQEEVYEGTCLNLSEGGLLLQLGTWFVPGVAVLLELHLESIGKIISARAVVVWSVARLPAPYSSPGMGLQFAGLGDRERGLLMLAIEKQRAQPGAEAPSPG